MYSIIIPVYRGEKTLEPLFLKIKGYFERNQLPYQVIFVYDCGPDRSWTIIEGLKKQFPEIITAVRLTRNFGQHNATICGFRYAKGDLIITMDEDLQHEADDIAVLIRKQKETGDDIVYGIYEERKHNFFRNATSNILKKMLALGIPDLHKDYTSFRLIRATTAKETLRMNNSYTFLDGYLSWITNRVSSVTVQHSSGQAGKSSYTFKKLIEHSVNIFVTFSNLPIRILILASFIILIVFFTYSLYILYRKIFFDDLVPGFATIIILCGFGFGLILFGLGIIGEYIQRINLKTTKRPNFLEAEIL